MAYGIIVDGTKKGCIGDIGIYHYCDEGVEYEGQRFEFYRCGISYDDNDGYLNVTCLWMKAVHPIKSKS